MGINVSAISEENNIKISIIDITDEIKEILNLQKTNPIASVALGRTVLNTALIGFAIKAEKKTLVNISGKGLMGKIIAEFQNNEVRGYVQNPDFDITKIDGKLKQSPLSQSVGVNGFISVSRENEKGAYSSEVELISGEINLDFMYYLQQSDQVHSLIHSSIDLDSNGKVSKAVGILIQLLPGYSDENINFLEEKVGSLEHLSKVLLETKNYESFIKDIVDDSKILKHGNIKYKCTCNMDKVIQSVKLLGEKELNQIKEANQKVEVICDFCKKNYQLSPKDIFNYI